MRHVGVCQDVRYLIISMQFIEENRKNVVFEEMSVREKFMKRCPRCNRVYSDLVSVCPECNVSLTSKQGNDTNPYNKAKRRERKTGNKDKRNGKKKLPYIILIVVLCIILICILSQCGSSADTSNRNIETNEDVAEDIIYGDVVEDITYDDVDDDGFVKEKTLENAETFEEVTATEEYQDPTSNYATVEIDGEEVVFFMGECKEVNDSGVGTYVRASFYNYCDGEEEYKLMMQISYNLPDGNYAEDDFERGNKAHGYTFSAYLYKTNWEKINDSTEYSYVISKVNGSYTLELNSSDSKDLHYQLHLSIQDAKQCGGVESGWGETKYTADFAVGEVNPIVEKMNQLGNGSRNSDNDNDNDDGDNDDTVVYDDDCPRCGGLGECDVCFGEKTVRCPNANNCSDGECIECGGDGVVEVFSPSSTVGSDVKTRSCTYCGGDGICNTCDGTGEIVCEECGGSGKCPVCGK